MNIQIFKAQNWIKNWSGNWSILSCSYFGEQYTKSLIKHTGVSFRHVLFIFHKEQNFCYYDAKDMGGLGKKLGALVRRNENFVSTLSKGLIKQTIRILNYIKINSKKRITREVFQEFQNIHEDYIQYHSPLKWTANYLPTDKFDKYFPLLEKARIIAEPVYKHYEDFVKIFDSQLGREVGYSPNSIRALTKQELLAYWNGSMLPSERNLQARYRSSALYFIRGKSELVIGPKVKQIQQVIERNYISQETLKGVTAYPGIVRGRVRIIFNPKNASFEMGEILVTGMTRPEYLPIMKKATGFITDAGGMLSHAAIVAREMKKPCIVGTEIATKLLKNGQMVELDATKGIVKVLK